MSVVTLKTFSGNGFYLENLPLADATRALHAALASGEQAEILKPALIFRDAAFTPIDIGDRVRITSRPAPCTVVRLFQRTDGIQCAAVVDAEGAAHVVPLSDIAVLGKVSPLTKVRRFLEVIRSIAYSYGQNLDAQTDIRARSRSGKEPALLIKSGPSPLPSLPYVIAVAYERRDAHGHVLIVPEGPMAGFPLYVHIGTYTGKHLLDQALIPQNGFDEAVDRMATWGEKLQEINYVAEKVMPHIDQSYDEEADEETAAFLAEQARKKEARGRKEGGFMAGLTETVRHFLNGVKEGNYPALPTPAEALQRAKQLGEESLRARGGRKADPDAAPGAQFKGRIPGVPGEVHITVVHAPVRSPKGAWLLSRYQILCRYRGRQVDLGGKRDKHGLYAYIDAYRVLQPEWIASVLRKDMTS